MIKGMKMARRVRSFFTATLLWLEKLSFWGRGCFFLLCLIVVTFLLFVFSNLFLSSSWGGDVVARRLEKRLGLECDVGAASWSPWRGVIVKEVVIQQPVELRGFLNKPLASVSEVQVIPYWSKLLKGKVEASQVTVVQPELTISLEMLSAVASKYNQSNAVRKGALKEEPKRANVPGKDKRPKDKPSGTSEDSGEPRVPEVSEPRVVGNPARNLVKKSEGKQVSLQKNSKKQVTKKAQTDLVNELPVELPLWLKVEEAQLNIVSVSERVELLTLSSVSLNAPIFGEDADGVLKIGELKALGQVFGEKVEEELQWRRPFLKLSDDHLNLLGLDIMHQSQVMMRRGQPRAAAFQILVELKEQPLREQRLLEEFAIVLAGEKVSGSVKVGGGLFAPLSWRGAMLGSAQNFYVEELHGGHRIQFDDVRAPAVFNRGQLRWGGLRLIGEDVAILGNGHLSSSGEILAVTRLVVSPEVAYEINAAMNGAMIPGVSHSWWKNLDTPDRKVRDVTLYGHVADPAVDLTKKYQFLSLWDVLGKMKEFARREMFEEGKVLQPRQNHEMFSNQAHESH